MLRRLWRGAHRRWRGRTDPALREVRLRGGMIQKVVRVGDTVRRRPPANADFVRALLGKLEAAGFDGVPRWLGIDARGRDIFSFVEGAVPLGLGHHDDVTLRQAASLIRRYHDATAAFCEDGRVACHNDLSPCNAVFRDGVPVALIDFDNAAEGERMFDLGYAAWLWLDIGNEADYSHAEQLRRLRLFAAAYGPSIELVPLLDQILLRQRLLIEMPFPWRLRGIGIWARRCLEATLRLKAAA